MLELIRTELDTLTEPFEHFYDFLEDFDFEKPQSEDLNFQNLHFLDIESFDDSIIDGLNYLRRHF